MTIERDGKPIGQSTQTEHPARAAIRSGLLTLSMLLVIANPALVAIRTTLEEYGIMLPDVVVVWLNAAIVGTAALVAGVNRLLLIPGVNDLLTRFGLGPVSPPTSPGA